MKRISRRLRLRPQEHPYTRRAKIMWRLASVSRIRFETRPEPRPSFGAVSEFFMIWEVGQPEMLSRFFRSRLKISFLIFLLHRVRLHLRPSLAILRFRPLSPHFRTA